MKLEVLHVPDCPNLAPMLDRLAQATDMPVATRVIDNDADAARFDMAGSPTLLVDGVDPFAPPCEAGQCAGTVSCRLYRDETGRIVPAPSVEQFRTAIAAATAAEPDTPAEVLSAWRTRAEPLAQHERTVHQAILRAFAATGHPPTREDLDAAATDTPGRTAAALRALHNTDAIRLAPDGKVAVAYPFSATPTRHRVRIGDPAEGVDVHAMCAIDALGIAPMLDEHTRTESVDAATGQPITVTISGGETLWEPASAVVFVGAEAAGGPSADCCCDYLNFFTDRQTAQRWADAHPHIRGQILDKFAAEALAARLFAHLLAVDPHAATTPGESP